jgi:nucleotide-binding universal stress UspA family protein
MNILVAMDLSASSESVVSCAREMARGLGAKTWLIHVADPDPDFVGYEPGPQTVRDAVAHTFHEEHRQLQACADQLRDEGVDCTALLVQGPTVATLLHEAEKLEVQLIILGSHGKGAVKKLLVGSTSEGVLQKATVPVLVVPTHGRS